MPKDALTPLARHHFTLADQVIAASEADPDMGFMARLMALCSLPRTNPATAFNRALGVYSSIQFMGCGARQWSSRCWRQRHPLVSAGCRNLPPPH